MNARYGSAGPCKNVHRATERLHRAISLLLDWIDLERTLPVAITSHIEKVPVEVHQELKSHQ